MANMELSKYIKSESVELNRSAIHFADYNPRKLSDESRKTLKRGIKKFGLVGGDVYKRQPYSRPLIECFVKRMAEHGNGIALLFNRCDSKMFQDVIFEKATAMKFLRNRIRFFRPDGTRGDSPGCGSILIAFGEDNAEVIKTCDIAGKYVRIN